MDFPDIFNAQESADSVKIMDLIQKTGLNPKQVVVFMLFGSKLYGTDTPDSDTDYKGIYMPTAEQILLQRVPKTYSYKTKSSKIDGERNTPEDIDVQIFSLHYFLDMAVKGETASIDMLHCPDGWEAISTNVWKSLKRLRGKFYTKNLKAFVSYARKQAAKYGIKGSRLKAAKEVLEFLEHDVNYHSEKKLADIWEQLPEGEHIHKTDPILEEGKKPIRMYQVCGKKLQETVTVEYAYDVLKKFWNDYGHRAELAAKNEGIDWKAVSHALRAAYMVAEMLSVGTITLPLPAAEFVRNVKLGLYDYKKTVAVILEILMNQIEQLSELSNLPEKVDRKFVDTWLLNTIKKCFEQSPEESFQEYMNTL